MMVAGFGSAWQHMAAGRGVAIGLILSVLMGPGWAGLPAPATAQDGPAARAELGRDTIRVGDLVPVVVRVPVGPGQRVVWPDTLPLVGSDAENAATVRVRVDTLPDGSLEATAVYAVTPWRAGEVPLPAMTVGRVAADEALTTATVPLPTLRVVSVLPDSGQAQPRPAKSVVGPSWAWTSILLVVLAVLAALAVLIWLVRRRRSHQDTELPAIDPRERALDRLDAALAAGLLERGAMKAFYSRVSHAVRGYLADLDLAWGDDLTTTEVLARFREHVGTGEATELAGLLHPADQVKFAQRRPDLRVARAEWEQARDWVLRFSWPPPVEDQEAAA